MEMGFKTVKNTPNLSVLDTYAPHMGYKFDQIHQYFGTINTYINTTRGGLIEIWRADNNGQISKDPDLPSNNLSGKWAIANKAERRNGHNLQECCIRRDLSGANTHFAPRE